MPREEDSDDDELICIFDGIKSISLSELNVAIIIMTGSMLLDFYMIWSLSFMELTQLQEIWFRLFEAVLFTLGTLSSGYLCDITGRRTTLIMATAPAAVSILTIMITEKDNLLLVEVARIVCRWCMGMITTVYAVYIGEVIRADVREIYCCISKLGIKISETFTEFGRYFWNWRTIASVYGALPLSLFVLIIFVPETPYWFLMKGDIERSKSVLKNLRRKRWSEKEFRDMVRQHNFMERNYGDRSVYWKIFKYRKVLINIIVLVCFQSIIENILSNFGNAIGIYYQNSGKAIFPRGVDVIGSGSSLFGTITATILVAIIGPKTLWYVSGLAMIKGMALMMYCYWNQIQTTTLPTTAFIVLLFSYSMGIEIIPWYFIVEIIPVEIRAKSIVIVSMWCYTASTSLHYINHHYLSLPPIVYMIIFCVCMAMSFWYVFKFLPDNGRRTLWEIQQYYINMDDEFVDSPSPDGD